MLMTYRRMLAIHDLSLGLMDGQRPCVLIINRRMKVNARSDKYFNFHLLILFTGERARISGAGGYVEYGRVNGSVSSYFIMVLGLNDYY